MASLSESPESLAPMVAADVARGVARLFLQAELTPLPEVPLGNGRRADLMAIDAKGCITIVEIKVSRADLLGDAKWPFYLDYCDRFFWAVDEDVPMSNHAILRSYDGTAFVARVGSVPCQAWGNSSIPCMHLAPVQTQPEQGGRVIFFVGSLEELAKELLK